MITANEALLWTDGRYFLQATQQLSPQWKLMRIGEDPPLENWIADVCTPFSRKLLTFLLGGVLLWDWPSGFLGVVLNRPCLHH